MQEQEQKQEINYTELLEKEYKEDIIAQRIIRGCRKMGDTDQEIYEFLESSY